ncbi:CCA tRNA nucleotidyltransferase [Anaerolentibacter hominis]|uniref:CCA tRNA nucleotidyltransferase n=1 Tax=Anaerolentibacter hominis TaxID=3079009 RepID=UPI0031B814FA
MIRIELPKKVEAIIDKLETNGYEAFAVGGCVRDSVMGREPNDWDITTSAKPAQIKELFPRTVDTGIQHGTVTVLMGKEGFEVTTYRIDGEYEDHRHPREVEFTTKLREDLCRRDFTINAMAYSPREGIVDLFGGIHDMKQRLIRCVGNPSERFEEDALRMMRAVRFSGQLGFAIHEDTRKAMEGRADNLRDISVERIREELILLLISPNPWKLFAAQELGITAVILPEFDQLGERADHAVAGIDRLRNLYPERDKEFSILCFAMLLHEMKEPRKILRRYKFDNYTVDTALALIKYLDYPYIASPAGVRRAVNEIGAGLMDLLFIFQKAHILVERQGAPDCLGEISHIQEIYEGILERGECTDLKGLAVNGSDLIQAGVKPGVQMGAMLKALLEIVLDEPEKNQKVVLLSYVKENKI